MKISYNWLKSLIEINESAEEIGKLLTDTGLEVEGIEEIESIKGGLKGFVVGEVLTCETFMVKEKHSLYNFILFFRHIYRLYSLLM